MDIIDNLTNEEISKKFTNQFDLVNYAISLASNMIITGRSPRVKMQTENPALIVLEEIAEGKDQMVLKVQEEVKKEKQAVRVEQEEEDEEDALEIEDIEEDFEDEVTEEALSE